MQVETEELIVRIAKLEAITEQQQKQILELSSNITHVRKIINGSLEVVSYLTKVVDKISKCL
jgi:uncharacterized coiled-coil protein SlyX